MTEPTEIPTVTPEPVPTSTSTQTRFPLRAAARTFVAVVLPAVVAGLTVIPQIIQTVLDEPSLPPGFRAILTSVLVALSAVAAIVTRIMAIKAVNDALGAVGLSAKPKTVMAQENKELAVEALRPVVKTVDHTYVDAGKDEED